jgi:hypothetical protein
MRPTLEATLRYARERDYTGWDLYDGESSRLLQALPFEYKWVNLGFQQLVRRAPVNIRPLLGVEQRRNYMGVALFTLANLRAYELTGDESYRSEALDLADWLVENRSIGYSGFCGGHNHPVQGLSRRTYPNTPGVVGTSCAVKALLAADGYADADYKRRAKTAADFVFEDLNYTDHPEGARIDYKPDRSTDHYTLNANALGARLLVDLYDVFGDQRFETGAREILDYVASQQTAQGGWLYRDPPGTSHLGLDNFHNGFIVESFLRYRGVCEQDRYVDTIDESIAFYRTLFDGDGAPHYDSSKRYPHDVHSSAQGAVVFSMLGEMGRARRILDWAVENLSDGNGRFYHEKRRFFTKRITLMRWCQAWMAHGLAVYAVCRDNSSRAAFLQPATGTPAD